MRRLRSGSHDGDLFASVAGGFVGGLAACFAMERFQRALGRVSPEIGGVPGAGGQQYRRPQSEPATFAAADRASEAIAGRPVSPANRPLAGSAIHYAFGGAVGAIYGAAAARTPDVAAWGGLPFGASVWMAADEIGMPLVGLARVPTEYPVVDHATTLASHLIFGLITESVRRMTVTALRR